jgi:hypothetical protein
MQRSCCIPVHIFSKIAQTIFDQIWQSIGVVGKVNVGPRVLNVTSSLQKKPPCSTFVFKGICS